ncbi:holin family protein [Rhodobacter sp. Har01]|uniref:holin family protein n=1 Tax=Rhodobacter sp. Har01 TaxID=2883999 RepID=UPI001D0662EF|nr:holin family protein [Rhodobacter sp. Har01]MCB6177022.1 holin family protein [Rhodobacter sp. Har01]
MGVIGTVLGTPGAVAALGEAAKGVAEVFTPSATKRMELSAEAQMAALRQLGEEYQHPALSWFDRLVNGLNRLPRPFLAFGTIGLFVYAMVDPEAFVHRMVGLNAVPEPLWWLLGAIVAFYFGARETHYFRNRAVVSPFAAGTAAPSVPEDNPALEDWRAGGAGA